MEFPLKICCSLLAALCLMGSGHALTQPNILEAGAQEQPASQSAPAWEEDQLEEYARQVFALTNQLREEEGLPALYRQLQEVDPQRAATALWRDVLLDRYVMAMTFSEISEKRRRSVSSVRRALDDALDWIDGGPGIDALVALATKAA